MDTCSGSSQGASYTVTTYGSTNPTLKTASQPSLLTPIRVNLLEFGAQSLPPPARTDVSLDTYVDGIALSMSQVSDATGVVFYAPQAGTLTFSVSGAAPGGYVYMIEGFQALGCSASDAWAASVNGTSGACTWAHTAVSLYGQYDPVALTVSTSALASDQWNGIYVLRLSKMADVEVPSSEETVDPHSGATEIQGAAGSVEMGGEFAYRASVEGDESISAFAAYFPGEITPVAPGGSAGRRKLLASETITVKVASGLLFLKRGNRTYAPSRGGLEFGGVGNKRVISFSVSVHQFTNCSPGQYSKVRSFANCTWTVVPSNISMTYNVTTQKMALGNLGEGTWNSVYMLSSVLAVPPPPPPPAAVKTGGGKGQITVIVVACIAGAFLVVGCPLMVLGGGKKRRHRSEPMTDAHPGAAAAP
jgi:hypothetical protein